MSQQERQHLEWLAKQFHLLICNKNPVECPRCKIALLVKELLPKAVS